MLEQGDIKKPDTIQFLVPEEKKIEEMHVEGVKGIKDFLFGKPTKVDFDTVQKDLDKRLNEVLALLSSSTSKLNDYQVDSVSFSVAVSGQGEVSILGIGGLTVGAETGFQITMVRKER